MRTSELTNEISAALSKAQGKIENASKSSNNPFFKSKYADLAEVINVAKDALKENNLSVIQVSSYMPEMGWILITRLSHSSGQWIEGDQPILTSKNDAQGFGAGMTYARRYALAAILGIAQEDDDGNEASKKVDNKNNENKVDGNVKVSAASLKQLQAYASDKKIKSEQMTDLISLVFGKSSSKDLTNEDFSKIMGILRSKSLDEISLMIVELKTEKEMSNAIG